MLASDYGDDALTKELDPNLDDDYFMLFKRRQKVEPPKKTAQRRQNSIRSDQKSFRGRKSLRGRKSNQQQTQQPKLVKDVKEEEDKISHLIPKFGNMRGLLGGEDVTAEMFGGLSGRSKGLDGELISAFISRGRSPDATYAESITPSSGERSKVSSAHGSTESFHGPSSTEVASVTSLTDPQDDQQNDVATRDVGEQPIPVNASDIRLHSNSISEKVINPDSNSDDDWNTDIPKSPLTPAVKDDSIDEEVVEQILSSIDTDNVKKFYELISDLKHAGHDIKELNLAPYLDSDSHYENALHHSLDTGALEVSKYIIQKCPTELFSEKFERIDEMGRKRPTTCLHIIAEQDQVELAQMMFERLDDDDKNELMYTKGYMKLEENIFREVLWLHVACFYGHLDIVKFSLDHGMKPDDTDTNGETGLFWACKEDEFAVAAFLLNKNADVNLVSNNGTPPLYNAVRHGSFKCVELIMEYSPDVSAKRGVGFETPLILASAFGHDEIAKVLLRSGADVMEKTSRGETAMHAAASEGWTNIMKVLLESQDGSATINACSKAKESPLHYAVDQEHLDAIEFLLKNGADSTLKDKHGKTVWHEAIVSHKPSVLETLLECTDPSDLKGKVSPLHLVAETVDSKEEFDIIKFYLDMYEKDQDGNTFLHTAAKHGNYSVVKDGVGIIIANIRNTSGNTPLHEAAKAGDVEIIKLLLRSCNLETLNLGGETALHSSIKSSNASADVVKAIVRHTKNTNRLDVLSIATLSGNTALHLAAKFNRPDVVKHLVDINPSIRNKDGDNALHVAARAGNLEALRKILLRFEYEMNINQRTEDGETLLHLAAKNGHVEIIGLLIDFGIDLAIQDDSGNTFLHDLAEQAGSDPDNQDMYDNVFAEVVQDCLKWWCKANNLPSVDEDSSQCVDRRKQALWKLRSEITNNDGLTALQVAVKHGASSLVEKMIQVPVVFVERSSKMFTYDVTNLLPDTFKKSKPKDSDVPDSGSAEDDDNTEKQALMKDTEDQEPMQSTQVKVPERPPVRASLLEVIVAKRPLNIANVMLDIEPLKQVADGYWLLYQFMTSLLLIIHIGYMSVLSAVAIPEIKKAMTLNSSETSLNTTEGMMPSSKPNVMYGVFLLWPLAMLAQEGYYIANRMYRLARRLDVSEPAFDEIRSDPKQPITFSDATISLVLYYLPHVINITFAIMVLVWFQLFIYGNKYHGVILAYVMLIGWLTTIAFTRTFRPMHGFTVMLRNIFIKDVLKFLFLYVFILLAFGFAFDCLARLSPAVYAEFNDVGEVFYLTLGMLLGAGDIMVDDIDDKYQESGYSPIHFKLIYLLYALVTVVVLLNILIAMMNDSYGDIKSKEGVSFRVLSIQQAINFEKSIPLLHGCFKHLRRQQQALFKMENRWYMKVPASYTHQESKIDDRQVALNNMIGKLDKICQQQVEIVDTLSALKTRVSRLEASHKDFVSQHEAHQ